MGRLDDKQYLFELVVQHFQECGNGPIRTFEAGDLYCSICGGDRRMKVRILRIHPDIERNYPLLMVRQRRHHDADYRPSIDPETIGQNLDGPDEPSICYKNLHESLFTYTCVQCQTASTVVGCRHEDDLQLVVFPESKAGLTTQHTPESVAFFLDQAARCRTVAANSAALAMFRAAIEQILVAEGYTQMMLGPKLKALEDDIKQNQGPSWAKELDTDYMKIIKDLGNASIHGDPSKQAALDNEFVHKVESVIQLLLLLIFDFPAQKKQQKAELKAMVTRVKK